MAWSGGSVTFTGTVPSSSYGVVYNAPTYTYPSNSTNRSLTVSSAGPLSVSCTASASQTYHARYYWPTIGEYVDDYTTISGTAPACPVYSYTVTWNANGGSVSPTSNTVTSGTSVTAPTPTQAGYSFNGWFTAASGGSLVVSGGSSYSVTSNITLYAQWTPITPKVWNGSSWTRASSVKVWNGSAWVNAQVKIWNGSSWAPPA